MILFSIANEYIVINNSWKLWRLHIIEQNEKFFITSNFHYDYLYLWHENMNDFQMNHHIDYINKYYCAITCINLFIERNSNMCKIQIGILFKKCKKKCIFSNLHSWQRLLDYNRKQLLHFPRQLLSVEFLDQLLDNMVREMMEHMKYVILVHPIPENQFNLLSLMKLFNTLEMSSQICGNSLYYFKVILLNNLYTSQSTMNFV